MPTGISPLATGLERFVGCLRSSATSKTSFAAYTAPESAQKATNASNAATTPDTCNASPEKTTPARTNPFFVHCFGRASRRKAPGSPTEPPASMNEVSTTNEDKNLSARKEIVPNALRPLEVPLLLVIFGERGGEWFFGNDRVDEASDEDAGLVHEDHRDHHQDHAERILSRSQRSGEDGVDDDGVPAVALER